MNYNKYHVAKKEDRTLDGIVFASKAEMNRYAELKILQRVGEISKLKLQPKFLILGKVKGKGRPIYYIGDFEYWKLNDHIVEDVKGVETAVFKLKWKLVKAKYLNYEFRIVK
jgi:hypothetical protein